MEELEIIAQVLRGDQERYSWLVERYQQGLVYHCVALVHDLDTAEEVAQISLTKAYFKLKSYSPEYRFSTWLYKIATNACFDHLRRAQHISLDDIPVLPAVMDSHLERVIKQDEASHLRAAVAGLPLKYQMVISLHYWREQTYEEIALIMDIPLGTVKTWLYRAKAMLKEKLDNEG
jgi:RNA polymerase sigma-70 factor (ECF subfamily)